MFDASVPRRSFLARLSAGIAAFSATAAIPTNASAAVAAGAADELDTWFGTFKGAERVFYDSTSGTGAPDAILFARNFMMFSSEKLGTRDADMSVIVSFRHFATPFGFNDAMWAKYPAMAAALKVDDPKTKAPAVRNYAMRDNVMEGFDGTNLTALRARGVAFTVCGAATAYIAGLLAGPNGDANAVNAELSANLIPGARIVPAGVIAVQRAQKARFGYTYTG